MKLQPADREALVESAYRLLMDRAAEGTIDATDPLRQLCELDAAWHDPDASWVLANSLLRVSERCQAEARGSARERAHANLVCSVTLAVYDKTRLRRLRGGAGHLPHAVA